MNQSNDVKSNRVVAARGGSAESQALDFHLFVCLLFLFNKRHLKTENKSIFHHIEKCQSMDINDSEKQK